MYRFFLSIGILLFATTACNGDFSIPALQSTQVVQPIFQTATQSTVMPDAISIEQETATAYFMITPEGEDCQIAIAGNPLDVSIPDGTLLNPGEEFIKIWRIRNAGTCIWTNQYTINWFSGDNMGLSEEVVLSEDVYPGEIIEIAVDMKVPMKAGIYQSNWKICDSSGQCFGLGPMGVYPFWVRIQVRQLGTITPSPKPTATATSIVFMNGTTELSVGDFLDLDSGINVQDDRADIQLISTEDGLVLSAVNQARITLFGEAIPSESQCANLLYVSESISLADMDTSAVLCYKSTLGLPGTLKFKSIDLQKEQIEIDYLTWYAP